VWPLGGFTSQGAGQVLRLPGLGSVVAQDGGRAWGTLVVLAVVAVLAVLGGPAGKYCGTWGT